MTSFIIAAGVFVALWTVVLAIYAKPDGLTEDDYIMEDC